MTRRAGISSAIAITVVGLAGCGGSGDGSPGRVCVGGGNGCKATLQEALKAAKDGATITLEAGRVAGPVTITRDVTIAGAGKSVIAGGGPVVTIGRGLRVTISGVTITGGATTSAHGCGADVPECGPGYPKATALGGGIEIGPHARVVIRDSTIAGNRAEPSTAVPSVTATCGERPCAFAQGGGGGIDNWGALTLTNTTVSDNTAGGGVTAQADGGGILSEADSTLTLDNSNVHGNRVVAIKPNARFASGGGVYLDTSAALVLRNSTVSGNRSEVTTAMPGSVDVNADAGGIHLGDSTTATIRGAAISSNTAAMSNTRGDGVACAGGISANGTSLDITDSALTGNRVRAAARTSSAKTGDLLACSGAIDLFADTAEIRGTRIIGNAVTATTDSGAALAVAGAGSVVAGTEATISDSVFKRNTSTAVSRTGAATVHAGALHNGHTLYLSGVTVTGNRATARAPHAKVSGGGIFNGLLPDLDRVELHLDLKHSTVAQNTPDQCDGC